MLQRAAAAIHDRSEHQCLRDDSRRRLLRRTWRPDVCGAWWSGIKRSRRSLVRRAGRPTVCGARRSAVCGARRPPVCRSWRAKVFRTGWGCLCGTRRRLLCGTGRILQCRARRNPAVSGNLRRWRIGGAGDALANRSYLSRQQAFGPSLTHPTLPPPPCADRPPAWRRSRQRAIRQPAHRIGKRRPRSPPMRPRPSSAAHGCGGAAPRRGEQC